MNSSKTKLQFLFPALVLLFISSCKSTPDRIPFPENETDFPQPVSKPLKFSDVKKLNWSNEVSPIKPLVRKFDFDKLPVKVYDSSGFLTFPKKPDSVKFDWDKLPDTIFDYNNLPTKQLKFETSVLEPPELIPSGPPRLVKGTSDIVYELGESEGLKGDKLTCIFEDKAGFLWIATDKGLYRYDGENLVLYIHLAGDYNIYSILEDMRGQIWLGTSGLGGSAGVGMLTIDPKAGIIKHLTTANSFFGKGGAIRMLLDDKGRIWITTRSGGVNIIDENSHTIRQLARAQGLSDIFAFGILQDDKNNIWISTFRNGLNILDFKNGKIKYLNKSVGLSTDNVTVIQRDNMHRIWIAGLGVWGENSIRLI
jgi:hypothetical protein